MMVAVMLARSAKLSTNGTTQVRLDTRGVLDHGFTYILGINRIDRASSYRDAQGNAPHGG